MAKIEKIIIRTEGLNTPPFRALQKSIKPRTQILYKNNIPRPFWAGLLIFFTVMFFISCSRTEPKILFGFIKLVQYQSEGIPDEYFSFFILAEDEDGFENLDELYIYHDREQLRWHIKSDEWLRYTFDGNDWIGTRSMAVLNGSLPRGAFRAVLINKGGESTDRVFYYDGNVRYPFPILEISGGVYTITSQWPVNRLVFYDSSGNYLAALAADSLTGNISQLRMPSAARTAALWAEDEENYCSAFTNVVPVN